MREPDRIIRLKTVLSRTGLSRSTIYRKIAEGTFPAQLKISTNGTGWHESDINRWIADPVAWRPKREFDAVFLGVGLGAMSQLAVEGGTSAGVIDALQFIAGYKTGAQVSVGRRVVVIGAGNTAIDAACAAKRLGAESVTILYRRHRENISAFDFEYQHALREGIKFRWAASPVALRVHESGITLTCVAIARDESGLLVPVEGSEFTMECDSVIPAIGQSPLVDLLSRARGVAFEHGRVVVDRATGQTTNPRYFAGGACANGGREVVAAVADGKRAAQGIAAWLSTRTEARLG